MQGILDKFPVYSIQAEYTRYLDADLLGKIVFQNFALNVLGIERKSIEIPQSRRGDLGSFDAGIIFENRLYRTETKISRWIVQKRNKINPIPRWAFSGLKHSANKRTKRVNYDLVFAVGINAPGLEDSREYWRHFDSLKKAAKKEGRAFGLSAWPHEREFLNHCGLFILPRQFVFTHCKNSPYITIQAISEKYDEFFAWGYDIPRLKQVWQHAIEVVNSQPNTDSQVVFPSAVGATSL